MHWGALGTGVQAEGLHWSTGVHAEGVHWGALSTGVHVVQCALGCTLCVSFDSTMISGLGAALCNLLA